VSRPTSVAAADSALIAALESAKTAAAAAEERVRVAALAWEHERTTADALARQVAEAERFLHASAGEHILHASAGERFLHASAGERLLDSTSTSYTRWRDQVLLALAEKHLQINN
jgi:uncharacterized protein (DUF952 family)